MQDKFNQFLNLYNNKSVEAEDPSALDQCMDLAFKYCDFLGIDRLAIRHPYAYQVWAQPNDTTRKYFDLFPNTTTFIPQVGDIAVFGITNGIPVGHISIVGLGSNLYNLISFDQNWDTIHYYHLDAQGNRLPYCRTVIHAGYYGCVGFLRPKSQSSVDKLIPSSQILSILNGSGSDGDKLIKIKALC